MLSLFHQDITELAHTFGGTLLDLLDIITSADGVGVDEINGGAGTDIMEETGGRIDIETGADNNEDISSLGLVGSSADEGHRLAEEHNEGTQQGAVACLGARSNLAVVGGEGLLIAGVIDIAAGAYLHELAVKMDDMAGAGLLVQVIDILGDDGDLILLLETGHKTVGLVGLDIPALLAKHIIEIGDQGGVVQPALVGGYLGHGKLLPEAVGVAEGAQATLCGDAGTGEYNYFLFHAIIYFVREFRCKDKE